MGSMVNGRHVAYAELQAVSNFSFLRGASHAEELVERAAALGLTAIGIADRKHPRRCGARPCRSEGCRSEGCRSEGCRGEGGGACGS